MADEPRRSGRATKGQHHKKEDEVTDPPAATASTQPAPSKTKKSAGSKKKKPTQPEQEAEEDDEEEEEDAIRCICGATKDNGHVEENWIGCENCNVWQHCDCVGVSRNSKLQPKKYLCELCGIETHPDLVEAKQNGVSFKKVAEHNRKEYAKHGETLFAKKKGGRKSEGPKESSVPAAASPPAKPTSTTEKSKSKTPIEEPARPQSTNKRKTSSAAPAADTKRRKSEQPVDPTFQLVNSISQLTVSTRVGTAKGLHQALTVAIGTLVSDGSYELKKGETVPVLAEQLALKLEYSMFMNHVNDEARTDFGGAYKDSFLRIQPNLKRNLDLPKALLEGNLTPDTLSTMSADDMKSDEQRAADAATMKQLEKQVFIEAAEEKPRMRRTHKGDEMVEDQNTIAAESLSSIAPTIRRRESQMDSIAESPMDQKKPSFGTDATAKTGDGEKRRSSSTYDIQDVYRNIDGGSRTPQTSARRQSSNAPPARPKNEEDMEVDRLLDNDDGATDSAPYSPADHPSEGDWHGKIGLKGAANVDVKAIHVAGADFIEFGGARQIFHGPSIIISGRIPIEDAVDYISSLFAASNTDVSIFDMVPDFDDNSAMRNFDQLFDYFSTRKRWGVVPEEYRKENVRDIYFFPIDKGNGPLPTFMTMLENNDFERKGARTRRHICAVFVVRNKANGAVSSGTPVGAGTVLSPVNQAPGSAMSPTAPGFPEHGTPIPMAQNGSNFPPNPYHSVQRSHDNMSKQQMIAQYLGPYAQAPAAVQLLGMAGDVDVDQLQGLRLAFEKAPETRDDLAKLTQHLKDQN